MLDSWLFILSVCIFSATLIRCSHMLRRKIIGAFHLHQNSDKSHFCLSSTFMLKKDRSEIYLSFDVNGKHLLFRPLELYFSNCVGCSDAYNTSIIDGTNEMITKETYKPKQHSSASHHYIHFSFALLQSIKSKSYKWYSFIVLRNKRYHFTFLPILNNTL